MAGSILIVNGGSSSLKFAIFEAGDRASGAMRATARGEIAQLNDVPHLLAHDGSGVVLADRQWPAGLPDAFATSLEALLAFADAHLGQDGLAAVGHRLVHGGSRHIAPVRVSPALLDELDALVPLDPLHLPHNLAPIRALAASRPGLAQVACFDTAFHHTLPPVARRFGLPYGMEELGVRRYGFHGLSYEFIVGELAKQAPRLAKGKVVAAHLGSGASLCALQGGRSVATTMGFSSLDGLLMATRSGSLDPGVLLYLGRQGHSFDDLEDILYRQSGLLGVSGISGDIRELLKSDHPRAQDAVELFTYRISMEVGALASALGGLDGLVFTAGIGEHAPAIRAAVCARLAWIGVRLDDTANAANASCISTADSVVEVRVIPTDEEAMISRHTLATIRKADGAESGSRP